MGQERTRARPRAAAAAARSFKWLLFKSEEARPAAGTAQSRRRAKTGAYLLLCALALAASVAAQAQNQNQSQNQDQQQQQQRQRLPDLVSGTSDEPLVALVGQDAFISCVAKNLQNYTVVWRFTNEAGAPAELEGARAQTGAQAAGKLSAAAGDGGGTILTAGRQRVSSDERLSIIQSHDTWLLKISNVRLSDTGTYICHTNSEPRVRVARILSVIKSSQPSQSDAEAASAGKPDHFDQIDYNFTGCCEAEYVAARCQRLCSFQQLASRYQSISIVHECYSSLPSIARCMVVGRNLTDCCQKRHIPARCNPMCGHLGDTSAMSVQDQSYCADYSASIMSCVAEGLTNLPGQPELVIVEAVSSSTLKVSWAKMEESELRKIDGWIINLTKLSSFQDTISLTAAAAASSSPDKPQTNGGNNSSSISVSFSSSSSSSSGSDSSGGGRSSSASGSPLAGLTLVDAADSASLASMEKLLAASSGTISLKLDKRLTEFSMDTLKPYTVYQIQMFAYNAQGRSQLTDPIRALTLAPDSENSSTSAGEGGAADSDGAVVEPTLPDTRKCCLDRGVTLKRCLDTLCDPVEADRATIADLMICAPWSNVTFSCLSSRVNHTDCCKARGVTPFCLSMCSGEVKRVDYRHFRCLTHMSTYTNCILESHNVLPSPPRNFTVGPITHTWAVLNWRAPRKHASTLQGFRIFWRRVDAAPTQAAAATAAANGSNAGPTRGGAAAAAGELLGDSNLNDEYYHHTAEAATNPYLLDALQPATVYETFVVAVNKFGQSESSSRFIFQTLPDPQALEDSKQIGSSLGTVPLQGLNVTVGPNFRYNVSGCCESSGVHNMCRQLCDYDLKVADVSTLVTSCSSQMPVILRCMAGSRNSVPCCRNRGVGSQCLNVCAGLTEHSPLVVATRCAADFGRIIGCMDEGSRLIPGAPTDLHTDEIKPERIKISWLAAPEDRQRDDIEYHVRYQRLQSAAGDTGEGASTAALDDPSALIAVVPLHPLEHNLILTTNSSEAAIDKLRANSRYSIYVTAENSYGISLPSLVLVVQTPDENGDPSRIVDGFGRRQATLGAPHSLEILRSDTESIVLKWIAPLFISNDAQIKYRVFFKLIGQQNATGATGGSTGSSASSSTSSAGSGSEPGGGVQQLANNWTVLETADTSALLRNLRYSSQYAITVQAFSKQMLGHMSEILLASTARPVPPTLNHPLVINSPVEGNNITIMCVALGQPTPTISMFINGLLVQKRTQPYVIYHLVNLVRGHLTITCFASNGHGKDYASVQSRTEVDVKFLSKAVARTRELRLAATLAARLTCEVSGNPQPTVVWTFQPDGGSSASSNSTISIVQPNDRATFQLSSVYEIPSTWTHSLLIKNATEADSGQYQCRARNSLGESQDTILLNVSSSNQSLLPNGDGSRNSAPLGVPFEPPSDMLECCKNQNVSAKCLPLCTADGLDVEGAFKAAECQPHLDRLMFCAADGSDHRQCCRARQVPLSCLRWCSGAKLNIPAICVLSSALDINQCFHEGRTLLPGPARNLRLMLASDLAERDMESTQVFTTHAFGSLGMLSSGSSSSNNNNNNNQTTTSTVISSMDAMSSDGGGGGHSSDANSAPTATSNSNSLDPAQSSEPLILEWDPPAKNPTLVQYYRVFWRPAGSRELSRTVTNLTMIKLTDLNRNKQYEFVVKATNMHGSSVYSEPLMAKPSEIMSRGDLSSVGMIWFMPSPSASHLLGRVIWAICFATLFMFTSLAAVMLLERKGYLQRFASSKSNSSRVSFANPAYLKDSDNLQDGDNITWETGHSLDVLGLPPQTASATSSSSASSSLSSSSADLPDGPGQQQRK